MCAADADYCRDKARVITVNATWRLAPWADVHYSSDADWWADSIKVMRAECSGQFWSGHGEPIDTDVFRCPYDKNARGLVTEPGRIGWGGNSGYCAIGLAYQFGASRIVLVGFDQQGDHWHEPHPARVRKPANFPMWRVRFEELAHGLARAGVEIVNSSRETSLTCFRRQALREVL